MCRRPFPTELGPNGLCYYHEKQIGKAHKSLEKPNQKSEKQTQRDRAYALVAKAHKARFPLCQGKLIGCTGLAEHTHHMAGRIGKNLLDDSKFLSVCASCHLQIEASPAKSRALGLSESRLAKSPSE